MGLYILYVLTEKKRIIKSFQNNNKCRLEIKLKKMFGSGVQARLRRLDIYRKLPSDLTEPTMAGALISLISTVIIGLLFFTEL